MSLLFDSTSRVLETVIKGATLRHQVIVNNLANIDTPGFQSLDLEFQDVLKSQLSASSNAASQTPGASIERLANRRITVAMPSAHETDPASNTLNAKVVAEAYDQPRLDGNTVDIDREMGKLGQNTLLHNTYIELLNRKYRMLKGAINGGARA